jgi:DNA polymerase III epsilon subunit-like protein
MSPPKLISGRTKSAGLKLRRPIAIIDLETTGTSAQTDRIVEIGILKVMPSGKTFRFRKQVKPGIKIPREAVRVHGIANEDVAHKPRFKAIARKVRKFIRGCDLVGFNLRICFLLFNEPVLRFASSVGGWESTKLELEHN